MWNNLLHTAAGSVFTVLTICLAGAWMARRKILHKQALDDLSKLVYSLLLPCMLVVKVSHSLTLEDLAVWWALPVSALFYIIVGFVLGLGWRGLASPAVEFRRGLVAACAFGNSGFIPLTLIVAVAANAPWLAQDETAGDRGIAYVSVYLLTLSPCLWGLAYPYLSGERFSWALMAKAVNPPVLAMLAGVAIGLVPPWKALFHGPEADLAVLTNAADIIGGATIPAALLVLGGNLGSGPVAGMVKFRDVFGVSVIRLALMPLVGIGVVKVLDHFVLLPADPVYRLVLLLQSCTPGAINLVLMCQIQGKGEKSMSALLFWVYLLSVPFMTAWLSFFLYLVFQTPP